MAANPARRINDRFICYQPEFLTPNDSENTLNSLWQQLEWSRHEIILFGRKVAQPRLSAWYGDPDARYRYSGLQLEPLAWHPVLWHLKRKVEAGLKREFNSVLVNAYRDGSDSMGWHADNEPELGVKPLVASISLGARRRFLLRTKKQSGSRELWLEPGSLLIMKPGCQEHFQHSLPKTRSAVGLRINLTFRKIWNQLPA
jgi:alkylated DNA repair dioxygenase AlkB